MLRQDVVCLASSGGDWAGAAMAAASSSADAAGMMGPTGDKALTAIGTAATGRTQGRLERPQC